MQEALGRKGEETGGSPYQGGCLIRVRECDPSWEASKVQKSRLEPQENTSE